MKMFLTDKDIFLIRIEIGVFCVKKMKREVTANLRFEEENAKFNSDTSSNHVVMTSLTTNVSFFLHVFLHMAQLPYLENTMGHAQFQ